MHFFYMDESGDTGKNLSDPNQPVMVLGGIAVRDKAWNKTQEALRSIVDAFFGGSTPSGFEFHSNDALSPNGDGFFVGQPLEERTRLAKDLLSLLASHNHGTFYTAIDKSLLRDQDLGWVIEYNPKRPYPVAFDANLSSINKHVKLRLGASARGMVFFDEKKTHHNDVRALMRSRRFEVAKSHRIKWVVEFGHPLDSRANPMIQLADLVAFSARRFLELEHGYRDYWDEDIRRFSAECYALVDARLLWKKPTSRSESSHKKLEPYLKAVTIAPKQKWKSRHGV